MKNFYRIALLFLLLFAARPTVYGQLANPAYEVDMTVHYGSYGGIDLTGYVTYELFVKFEDPDNYLLSVFGEEDPNTDCVFDNDTVTFFNFPCGLFQFESETAFGSTNTCLNNFGVPGYEAEPFDSYVTIGYECSSDVTADIPVNLGFCEEWIDAFEGPTNGDFFDGGSFFWDGYAVSLASAFNPTTSAARAGDDLRVKIGQFTSCGGWNGCFNITYKTPEQVGNPEFEYVLDVCLEVPHPCLDFPLDTEAAVTNPACFGDQSQVIIEDGGFSTVDYSLFSGATIGSGTLLDTFTEEDNGLVLDALPAGSYYVTMLEATGCRDTTAIFTIVEPTELIFEPALVSEVLCFGENTGAIEVICSGGTGQTEIIVNGGQSSSCGDILENLSCGIYDMIATDENGCTVEQTIDIVCPTELQAQLTSTDIPCFDYDNGTISGNINGGTGELTITLTLGVDIIETINQAAPVAVNFENLDGGDYTVDVIDANGCSFQQAFTILEPEPVIVTPTTTDAICFNSCDGTVVFDIQGGTGPFIENIFSSAGVAFAANELCAGQYSYEIIDANECSLTGDILINQPDDITSEVEPIGISCFGICDGSINVSNVAGGTGVDYSYSLSPNAGNCVAPCLGTSATIENLCAGSFTLNITDEVGCVKNVPNIVVVGPEELLLNLNPTNVSCFGDGNGMIILTSSGGTGNITLQSDGSAIPQTINNLVPGNYAFTIQDENGCLAVGDVDITEPDLLVSTVIQTIDVTCGGDCDGVVTYEVTGGTAPFGYTLDPTGLIGISNGTIGQLCADAYTLTILDANACVATMEFEINEPTPLQITFNVDAPTCTGMTDGSAQVVLTGGTGLLTGFISPSDLEVFNNGNGTYTISNLGETTIEVELIDEVGCSLEDAFDVVPDIITDMVLTTFSSPETCWNEQDGTATIGVQNGNLPISYQWDDPNEQITATAIGLSSSETYTVVVTDDIGCTLTTSVFVEPTIGCFFITTALTPNGDGSNDTWLIGGLEFFPNAKVEVFNRWGQKVFESKGYNAPWDGTFKGEALPVADYYFIIEYDNTKEPILGTVTIKY